MSELEHTPARDLDTIATEIRAEVEATEKAWSDAVGHAIRAGELLTEAKSRVKHGEWMAWLEANFPGTPQTANGYMRLAANRDQIENASSIRGALKSLAAPKPPTEGDEKTVLLQGPHGVVFHETGVDIPEKLTFEQWGEVGEFLENLSVSHLWDWDIPAYLAEVPVKYAPSPAEDDSTDNADVAPKKDRCPDCHRLIRWDRPHDCPERVGARRVYVPDTRRKRELAEAAKERLWSTVIKRGSAGDTITPAEIGDVLKIDRAMAVTNQEELSAMVEDLDQGLAIGRELRRQLALYLTDEDG